MKKEIIYEDNGDIKKIIVKRPLSRIGVLVSIFFLIIIFLLNIFTNFPWSIFIFFSILFLLVLIFPLKTTITRDLKKDAYWKKETAPFKYTKTLYAYKNISKMNRATDKIPEVISNKELFSLQLFSITGPFREDLTKEERLKIMKFLKL